MERIGNPLQYSWLENPMDGGVWRLHTFDRIAKSRAQLSDYTYTYLRENAVALHRIQNDPIYACGI